MAKLPSIEEMAKKVAEKALDEYIYKGKTLREWIDILEQTRWIPRCERNPKDNEDVFVQIKNGKDRFFDIARIVKMKHPAFDKDFYWEARHPWDDSSIEAWMPLPEQYKEAEECRK